MSDELTDFEKMINGISQFAALIIAYYNALIDGGLNKEQAIFLTAEYQKEIIGLNKQ